MFKLLLNIIVIVLGEAATLASLITAIITIAALAIAGTIPQAEYMEIIEFDLETLRNRRRHLRVLPQLPEELTPPQTPPLQAQEIPLAPQLIPEPAQQTPQQAQVPLQEPVEDNHIIPPHL